MKSAALILLASIAVVAATPAAATIIISSEISLQANANAGNNPVIDTNSDSQGATINPLGPVSVSALSVDGNASAQALATVSSSWSNASIGQVIFTDIGFITANVTNGSAETFSGLDWQYVFVATASGSFELDFSVSTDQRTTDAFGLNGVSFLWSGTGGGEFLTLDTSGTVVRDIIAGTQYTFGLRNASNIFGGLGTRTALMDAIFDFRIPVPEPSAFALLALTLPLLVVVRRRRTL
jgi:hypothetical protein